jgi:hypothetical protein
MPRTVLAVLGLLCVATSVHAQHFSAEDLARRTIERRAVEAVIWGMPAVNTDLMLQEMLTKTAGKVNQIVYWGRPLDWRNQTLTPNPDAIYFMAFFNTKDVGPVVIAVPPGDATGSLNGNIVTVWQTALEDVGLLGLDKGAGGKFVILPPGYTATVPDGYTPLPSDTYSGYALLRSNLHSHSAADVAAAIAYGKRAQIYPLSTAAHPPETVFTDAKDVEYDSTMRYDLRFFQSLDRVVQSEPWIERDRAMIDPLRSSQIPEMQQNADGAIDVYFGPKAPAGKESNWVPTDPQRGFELMFRLYAPKKEFFEKVWKLPDVEKIAVQ